MATPNSLEKAIWLKLMGMGCVPWAILGNVFYVDGVNGNDGWDGLTPDTPFLTITHALTQCVADHDDYIIVLEHWQEVVAINITRVHIIAIPSNPNHSFVQMNAALDTAIFTVSALSNNCEIAGFSFGGGATHAGIENPGGTPMGLYIHSCQFGHAFAGDTPQDGIRIDANATAIRIEHCFLFGDSGKGTLSRDGIRFAAAANSYGGAIVNNRFQGITGISINIVSHGEDLVINGNKFSVPDLANGEAITLAAATVDGVLVDDNAAMNGNAQVGYGFNPYRDLNAPNNHWGRNYRGNTVIEPVIA